MEVRGSVKQLIRVNEAGLMTYTRDNAEATKSRRIVESEQVAASKSSKRKNNVLVILVAAGFMIMIGFGIKKLQRSSV